MIIVCPRCGILYAVEPGDLAAEARTVRCSNCDREWLHTPAAALPDNDDALRLLAASFGRGGPLPVPPPGRPQRMADAPPARPPRQDAAKASARPAPPPPQMPAEPEPAQRGAQVTALFRPPRLVQADDEMPPRAGRLSSRQLDALLNGGDAEADADPPVASGLRPGSPADEEGAQPKVGGSAAEGERTPPVADAPATPALDAAGADASLADPDQASAPPAGTNDGAAATPAVGKRLAALRRPRAAVVAAGAVAATVLVSVGLLAASRGLVMAAFPGATGFYSAVGLAPGDDFAEGLEIRGVNSTRSWSDGEQVLTVAGDLANVAGQPRDLPMVRVVLVDGSDAEVQEVIVVPPKETLPGGETVRFEARISNPVDTAERIKVSLTPRPAPS